MTASRMDGAPSDTARPAKAARDGRAWRALVIGVIIVLAAGTRLYRLGHDSLWIDEVYQVRCASQSLPDIIRNYRADAEWGKRDQAPLSFLVLHFFAQHAEIEHWARLPSAVFGVLGVAALYWSLRRLLPFAASSLAALLLALSPLHVWYSQEARWYALWSLLVTVAYGCLIGVWHRHSAVQLAGYAAATAAGIYTFIYSVFVIAAQVVSVWLLGGRGEGSRRRMVGVVLAVGVALLVSIPVLSMIVDSARAGRTYSGTHRPASLLELPYAFLVYSAGFTVGPTVAELHFAPPALEVVREHPEIVAVFAVFAPVFVLGILRVVKDPPLAIWLLPWLVVPPLMSFAVGAVVDAMTFQVRYTFASLAPFTVVVALGILSLQGSLRRVATAAVIGSSVFSLYNLYANPRYDREDVRGAMAHVRSSGPNLKQVLTVGQIVDAMPLYGRSEDIRVIDGCGSDRGVVGELDPRFDAWVVSGRDWSDETPDCLASLRPAWSTSVHREFAGVEVWRLIHHRE